MGRAAGCRSGVEPADSAWSGLIQGVLTPGAPAPFSTAASELEREAAVADIGCRVSPARAAEVETLVAYAHNTSAFVVGRVGQVIRRAPGGPTLSEEQYLYDGASGWTTAPVKGDLTTVRRWLDDPGSYVTRQVSYDPKGNVTRVTDETGRWVETSYDQAWGLFPQQTENAANETVSVVWDMGCGAPTTVTDANLQATATQYGALCRPTRTDLPLGGFVERFYLDLGNPTSQRTRIETPGAPGAGRTDWSEGSFDGFGRGYRSERRGPSAEGDIWAETAYNARGGIRTRTEPFYYGESPRDTVYEYDALGRVAWVWLPGGLASVETLYDAASRTVVDPNGKEVTTRYDAYGRAVEVERSLSGQPVVTSQVYDPLGRLVAMEDAVGNQWQWSYDSLGRLRVEDDPDAGQWSYTYDPAGRLLAQQDAKG